MKKVILTLAAVVLLAGCGAKPDETADVPKETAPAAQPAPPPAASDRASKLTGRVVETHDAGGYTYVKVDAGGEPRWAAVAQTNVEPGHTITIDAQMTVDNFESKTLGRKFDRIIFGSVDGPEGVGQQSAAPAPQQAMPPGHPDVAGMGSAAQHMSGPADAGPVSVPKAEGANAMTVAQVWSGKPGDQPVVVRGKVVKFLAGIMGKNWLHIRDGSGSPDGGDHDLTVTTNETAVVGDIVTVRGVVRIDRDFGAGYRYPVIVEDARLSRN